MSFAVIRVHQSPTAVCSVKTAESSKVTLEQAAKFAESLVHGELNRSKAMVTQIADKVRELV